MLAPHRVSSLLQAADFSLLPPVSRPDPTPPRDGWKQRHSSESPGQECRMNDPGAPADECVLPDCLRWPAVAIRMSSSEDETRRLELSSAGAACRHTLLRWFLLRSESVWTSALSSRQPLLSRCKGTSSSKNICRGGINLSFCLARFSQGKNKEKYFHRMCVKGQYLALTRSEFSMWTKVG